MLKQITRGLFGSSSKKHKSKLSSKRKINNINYTTNSMEKEKEKRNNKTPFKSPTTQTKSMKKNYYKIKESSGTKQVQTSRNSPKNTNNSYYFEIKKLNTMKYNSTNKSNIKDEKIKSKSKNKNKVLHDKETLKIKSSSKQIHQQQNNKSYLVSSNNVLKKIDKSISFNKCLNGRLNTNLSFLDTSYNNNINSIGFHNKSKSKNKIKESNKTNNTNNKSRDKKSRYTEVNISNISRANNKSKNRNLKDKKCNSFNYNTIEAKPKLFSINNNYASYNNYSLYIIDEENDLAQNKYKRYSTEKDYINIINQKTNKEGQIIENLLKLEARNWYEELIYISNRINKIGEISKNFNEILEKYMLIYNQFNWIIYSLSSYFKNILEKKEKDKNENFSLNYDVGLSNNYENWIDGFIWKNLYIKVIPFLKSKILINEMKALNYYFFEYLQIIDTNSTMNKNNYMKKVQLSNNIIFPLIGYSKIYDLILFVSVVIKPENKSLSEKNNSNASISIEDIIEQSNKLINYYLFSSNNPINLSKNSKNNYSFIENSNYQINNSSFINRKKIMLQININKYNDLDLESAFRENFYINDLMQSKLFKKINNYNLIKIKQDKYIIFNLAKYIQNLFELKLKTVEKFHFYSEINKEKKYFTLNKNPDFNKNEINIAYKYIKTPEDVLDKIYNMKNNFISPLNYKEIYINNIYFKIIYEKIEKTKKDFKSKSFVDYLFNFDINKNFLDGHNKNTYNIHRYNNTNLNDNSVDEKNYIRGKYVILYDLVNPIKLDFSIIKNHNAKNESNQIDELFFLKTNYFSHFISWCEMMNKNNLNIKSYSDLKYYMKKYSINTNLLFFSLVYIINEDISDIIQIHLLYFY